MPKKSKVLDSTRYNKVKRYGKTHVFIPRIKIPKNLKYICKGYGKNPIVDWLLKQDTTV